MRAIAGVWPWGRGSIHLPKGAITFMPQKPYFPLGTLRDIMLYPAAPEGISDEALKDMLHRVGLDHLRDRLHADGLQQRRGRDAAHPDDRGLVVRDVRGVGKALEDARFPAHHLGIDDDRLTDLGVG